MFFVSPLTGLLGTLRATTLKKPVRGAACIFWKRKEHTKEKITTLFYAKKGHRLPPSRVLLRVVSLMRRRDTCSVPSLVKETRILLLSLISSQQPSRVFFFFPFPWGQLRRDKSCYLWFWRDTCCPPFRFFSFLFQGKGHYMCPFCAQDTNKGKNLPPFSFLLMRVFLRVSLTGLLYASLFF